MFIKSLYLNNFRNFVDEKIEFGRRINVLVGKNAQGKTNILEAIYLLLTGRSFRTSDIYNTQRIGSVYTKIKAKIEREKGGDDIVISIGPNDKQYLKNSKPARAGGIGVVIFSPEEMLFLRESPSARRRYTDSILSQIIPHYRANIRKYERVISQKNSILQDEVMDCNGKRENLIIWNRQIAEYGALVCMERMNLCRRINEILPEKYNLLSNKDGRAEFTYRPQVQNLNEDDTLEIIKEKTEKQIHTRAQDELQRRMSLVGPHRDDFEALIGDRAVTVYGSQGQARTFVLALKAVEVELLRNAYKSIPVLLIDDVSSELDSHRNEAFWQRLMAGDGQVFITTTDTLFMPFTRSALNILNLSVKSGRVSELTPDVVNVKKMAF